MRWFAVLVWCVSMLFGGEFYYMNANKRVDLTPVDSAVMTRSSQKLLHFRDLEDRDIAIANRLLVKLKNRNNLGKYLTEYDMKIIKEYPNNMFLFETNSAKLAIDIANILSQKPDVIYAQPDLIRRWNLR